MCRSLWLVLTAISGTTVVASEDASALLQVVASTQKSEERECQCLPWADVYEKHNVVCGTAGKELAFMPHPEAHPDKIQEVCSRFFERFPDRHCLQTYPSEPWLDQWCYVSSKCDDLNAGAYVEGTDVSWKHCRVDTKDALMASLKPEQLAEISQKTDTDLAELVRLAYPLWMATGRDFLYWPGAQMALKLIPPTGNMTRKMITLYKIMSLNRPYVLNSLDGRPPYGIVWGKKIWEVKYTMFMWNHIGHLDEAVEHPTRECELACVLNCGQT